MVSELAANAWKVEHVVLFLLSHGYSCCALSRAGHDAPERASRAGLHASGAA